MLPLTEFYLLSFHLRFDTDKWNSSSQNTSTSYYTRLNTYQDLTFCCTQLISVQLSLTCACGELRGGMSRAALSLLFPLQTALSLSWRAGPMQTCPGHAGTGWLQPFTKLTFTNPYILNLLSVSDYKESLQCRIWSIHCFDVLI